jgi:hypothetical protein
MTLAALATSLELAACQAPPTQPAQNFVSAATALAQAESDYFDQIQAASDAAYQLEQAAFYADHKLPWKTLVSQLPARDDFSKAKALRMAAMTQLQNYAQQVSAILTASTDTSIATAARTDVADLNQLGTNAGVMKISAAQLTLIQTAVGDLAQAIVANKAASQLQSLAQQASKPIQDIGTMVDADKALIEDTTFANALARDQTTAMTEILEIAYTDNRLNSAERLSVYSQYRTNWKPALVTKGADIAAAMQKLKTANDEMQTGSTVAASVWLQQAYQLAQQALATQPVKK